ncbi:MAG: hypothetical protein DSY81_11275 [Bacillota bacterium]|nr:MAG: hypothetical protein DSY81_11275 [Bacillota bacterium]
MFCSFLNIEFRYPRFQHGEDRAVSFPGDLGRPFDHGEFIFRFHGTQSPDDEAAIADLKSRDSLL